MSHPSVKTNIQRKTVQTVQPVRMMQISNGGKKKILQDIIVNTERYEQYVSDDIVLVNIILKRSI